MAKQKENNTLRNLLNIATILSITLTALKLGMTGKISPEHIAYILVFCVFIIAIKSKIAKIVTVLLSLFLFAQTYASNNQELMQIIGLVLTLLIALVGLYIMFGGWRKK